MRSVHRKDTLPERTLRKALHHKGFRYRLNVKDLPGSPDIVLPKRNTVLFVHGCYWHRHAGCPKATMPSSNIEFWAEKFVRNVKRDARNIRDLLDAGWRVGVVWECAIGREPSSGLIKSLEHFIVSGKPDRAVFEP